MANIFFAAFIPGLRDFTAGVIKERLPDVKIHKLLDGAVLFETETTYDKLNFFCFNNIFAVINLFERPDGLKALENHLKYIINYDPRSNAVKTNNAGNKNDSGSEISRASIVNLSALTNNSKKINTFRIVVSNGNVPVSVNENLRAETEKAVSRLSGLKVNRSLPDTEFWFLFRNEESSREKSFSVFMKRLTMRASWDKALHKGELPPPLAWTLCSMAFLSHNDTVLDPFCGYGSIPKAALKYFHVTHFTACDINADALSYTSRMLNQRRSNSNTKGANIIIYNKDFYALPSLIEEKSVDAIVTDPPWGEFNQVSDDSFYEKMFDVFFKLLKDGGRAVILYSRQSSQRENIDRFLKAAQSKFIPRKSVPILLSGKKAVIYSLVKQPIPVYDK